MPISGKPRLLAGTALVALASGTLTGVTAAAASASTCSRAGAGAQLYGVAATSATSAWAVGNRRGTAAARTLIEQWNGTDWCRVPSPNPSGSSEPSALVSVSATSATDAWAVGYFYSATGGDRTLILHWDGTSWKRVPSPDPSGTRKANFLIGVSAVSPSDAWAVGHYADSTGGQATMLLHWDGTSWTQVASPNPAPYSDLYGVAATSSAAWAVGSAGGLPAETLAIHPTATGWKQVVSPNPSAGTEPNALTGVAVASSADAWAVGGYSTGSPDTEALILHWNGTSWRQETSPEPGLTTTILSKVTATSASSAWAVGYYSIGLTWRPLVLHWDGTSWTQAVSPDPGGSAADDMLNDVAATSASDAWAVGSGSGALILHWDGTRWTHVSSP